MNIRRLYAIMQKNIKLLLRAKAGMVVLLLGPLLLIIIAGIAFNHSEPYAVSVGAFSSEYSDLTNKMLSSLEGKNFIVERYDSAEACTQSIKNGKEDACIVFPPKFNYDTQNAVEFSVDYNQINLVNHILNVFDGQIEQESDEVRRQLTTSLVEAVTVTRKEVEQNKPLIVGLATGVEAIKAEASSAHAALSSLAVPSTLPSLVDGSNQSITQLFIDLVNATNISLDTAKADIDLLAANTNETSTEDGLEMVSEDIAAVQAVLAEQGDLITGRLDNFTSASGQIATELQGMIDQLSVVQSRRDSVTAQLGNVEKRVQDNLLIALKLQESLNRLSSSLDGLSVASIDQIARPFRTVVNPIAPKPTYLAYLFPALLVLISMFSVLLIGPTLVHLERSSPANTRTRLARSGSTFFTGLLLSILAVATVQILIVSIIGDLFMHLSILSLGQSLGVAVMTALFFAGIGLSLGFTFKTESGSIAASVALAAVLLFTSNLLLPMESMPALMRSLLAYNPLTFSESIIRNILLYDSSIFKFAFNALVGVGATVISIVVAFTLARKKL